MNFSSLLAGVKSAVAAIQPLIPIATAIGGPGVGAVLKLVSGASQALSDLSDGVSTGVLIATETDKAELAKLQAEVQAHVDSLEALVDAS